ncbi:calmodulin-binding protein 60 B [Hordeum vulgare]|uniref:Calmodulin-binding protein n=1 Tax=Hordeum vulgare subsp. vulgare TaxID=112509 RepID=A0A8I6YRI5_HORVV|nr:calmodulin-binding protein 60 B-like [Hordeum vulgare subsp. vulgare]XP_044951380.1 calmodulin-binding protein 60 B-like [Hordeum vulgare subsp. vulgare]KAE8778687.1 calmodulin-binding protein 60 B [Hordeum vulgare]KAI4978052.1 hypothetical protein ZWY2020_014606 [Hordeum vulgare]
MNEKRGLEAAAAAGDGRPEAKRSRPPALARSSPKRIEGPGGKNLQLQFRTRLSLPLFTGGKVEGEQGASIHVVLLDTGNGCVVSSGPESSAKLGIVVLEGDFNNEDEEGWTEEEFDSHVVKEREGKRPIITGDIQVTLKDGVGTIGEFTFTDNSSWIRSRKFRLGLKIASGFCQGVRIREAKTEAFMVKDHRGELFKKHYPPALKDEVWRLEKIGKDGSFHKRLNKSGILTVEDFLRLVVRDPQKLRTILGSAMSNKMWDSLVEHAKTCVLSGKYYIYYSDEHRTAGAIFNDLYAFCGLISGEQFYSSESLDDGQKLFADGLVKKAYDNWMYVIEYDGKALLNPKPKKKAALTSQPEARAPAAYVQRISSTSMPGPCTAGTNGSIGYDGNQTATQSVQLQSSSANVPVPYDEAFSFLPDEMFYMPSPLPTLGFEGEPSHPSGKAVVGWLKIKAAMKWGIFVRKKAAERRARIVELDD